jgi:hypothetical protein
MEIFFFLNNALAETKRICEIESEDAYLSSIIIDYLEKSKAKNELNNIVYRPYIVAYKFLKFNRLREGIIKAQGTDGVEWEKLDEKLKGLLEMQQSLDNNLSDIPDGWKSLDINLHLCSVTIV